MGEKFKTRLYEVNSRATRGGKRPIKLILHKIMSSPDEYQENGVSWKEEYVIRAMETAKQAPIAVEYITKGEEADDTEISGHGYVCNVQDADGNIMPLYNENSEVVGSVTDCEIVDIKLDGVDTRVLLANGFLYEHRCKGLVAWLKKNVPLGNVMGSVEIVGLPENGDKIVYEDGWKENGRVPMEYAYSGYSILSYDVPPADDACVVLEVNEKQKEEPDMNEEVVRGFIDELKSEIHNVFDKDAERVSEVNELNACIADKDKEISELNAQVENFKACLEQIKNEQMENDAKYQALWEEREQLCREREALEAEMAKIKVASRIKEMEEAIAVFSDEEKDYAKEQINAYRDDPMGHEICSITDVIYREIGKARKVVEDNITPASEQNEKQENEDVDIFAEVFANEKHIVEKHDEEIF